MSRIHPECPDSDSSDPVVKEDKGGDKEDEDDDETDDGYSEWASSESGSF